MGFGNRFLEAVLAFQVGCASFYPTEFQDSHLAEFSRVRRVKPEIFRKEVLESKLPVFLYIHAQECPPCDNLYDNLLALYSEYKGDVKFCRMDIETQGVRETIKRETSMPITGYPTIFFFDKGQLIIARDYGYSKKGDVKHDIDKILLRLYDFPEE